MSFAISVLLIVAVFIFADRLGKIMIGRFVIDSPTYVDFIKSMLRSTYALIIVTSSCWMIFGEAAQYTVMFSTSMLITFARLDYQDLEEDYGDFRKALIELRDNNADL